ncbi:DHA3 family tetracycline resistance protein-like MFS transporter [Kribbella sp. VKM Ac-2527]|uniref:DHA3 family tetracycline resistance protein-like MFS transporter n=1 Tax=Kribbella caucasensis TaxID=2512215 RepID=A0A4R6J5A3_9ACTN|nr:MFS transporter [Kribbella sp. VKM Ac-2527]TDO30590.1 DHA3 family tetracycline resistance protein-like MFS transporter [Kribbella sp. VKM Ac-2527]
MFLPAYRAADPVRTYFVFKGAWSFLFALAFTLSMVYYVADVGLDPLQLVLVGTTLELACFLFEVPTGIVADLYSRRLSIIIGCALIGAGILLQGLVPAFLAILAAQVLWGIGYTFVSGADHAWITDEIGADRIGPVFVREQQIGLTATIAGTVTAGAFGLISLPLPMTLAGAGMMLLAIALFVVMPERHFERRTERQTFRRMGQTFKAGLQIARTRPVVRTLVLISLISGLSSEAFDRLWTVKILEFDFPELFGTSDPAFWFTVLALVGTLLSLAASLVANKVSPERVNALHPNGLLALLSLFQLTGVIAFALFGNLCLALVAMWVNRVAGSLSYPIESAWLNRNLESGSRATVISMVSQANAIGQSVGGPPLGALAGRTTLRTALVVSGLILTPIPLLYLRLRPARTSVVQEI